MRHFTVAKPFNFFNSCDKEREQCFRHDYEKEQFWKPLSRVKEMEKFFYLSLDIPGVDKEHLKVELKENTLNISGEREDHFKREGQEVDSRLKFEQRYTLPQGVNADEIEVHQENGVLDIVIPKVQKNTESKSFQVNEGRSQFLG